MWSGRKDNDWWIAITTCRYWRYTGTSEYGNCSIGKRERCSPHVSLCRDIEIEEKIPPTYLNLRDYKSIGK
jgi:hypothetical protein